jgi:hypothetical protein
MVLDGHCFHCIIGPDRAQFLREAFRVLKPAGVFHLNTMCGDPGCEEHRRQFDLPSRCLIRDGMAVRQLNLPDGIEKEITGAGFTVLGSRILPRRNDQEVDLLLLAATKNPESFLIRCHRFALSRRACGGCRVGERKPVRFATLPVKSSRAIHRRLVQRRRQFEPQRGFASHLRKCRAGLRRLYASDGARLVSGGRL